MEVVDRELAVEPRAVGDSPREIGAEQHIVAQRAGRIGRILRFEPLHQDVGNRANRVER